MCNQTYPNLWLNNFKVSLNVDINKFKIRVNMKKKLSSFSMNFYT